MAAVGKKAAAKKTAGGTAVVVDKLERHPLSEKYGPKMSPEEQLAIGLDMKEHGQYEEIVLFEGKVLAGWNRYMGGLQQGLQKTLKFKNIEEGMDPTAVAFGTNFIRRKLSSVQKAFYGAQYAIDTGKKQTDVAKTMACNLNRLNQCVQLLKAGTDAAATAIEKIKDNPEMSGGAFDELMIEAGIAREAPPPAPAAPAPSRTGTHADDDDDDGLGGGDGLEDDDLTGGAIDGILGSTGDDENESPAPKKKAKGEIGTDDPLPPVGSKPGKMTNPHETPVSRVSKAFRSLSADEQRQFVRFAWAKLKGALDAAIKGQDVEYTAPEPDPTKLSPSIIAMPLKGKRGKDAADTAAGDGDLLEGKKPAAKKAPAKKTPAKKAPAKKQAKGG